MGCLEYICIETFWTYNLQAEKHQIRHILLMLPASPTLLHISFKNLSSFTGCVHLWLYCIKIISPLQIHLKITLESLQNVFVLFCNNLSFINIYCYMVLFCLDMFYMISFKIITKMGISVALFMLPLPYSIMQKLCLRIGNYTSVICRWCFKVLLDLF